MAHIYNNNWEWLRKNLSKRKDINIVWKFAKGKPTKRLIELESNMVM
jgi:hypothetical protein